MDKTAPLFSFATGQDSAAIGRIKIEGFSAPEDFAGSQHVNTLLSRHP